MDPSTSSPRPSTPDEPGVQQIYAPESICFGCGPANAKGLRIASHRIPGGLSTVFQPRPEHQAFTGVVNGGILGTLIDCHGNWTAAVYLMDTLGGPLPSTVTARFEVRLLKPTPFGPALTITSHVAEVDAARRRVTVDVEVACDGVVTAEGRGTFVAVEEGHPAYHRWD
jgi:acyl-coenzyme A thioesterase PaaI-like protein